MFWIKHVCKVRAHVIYSYLYNSYSMQIFFSVPRIESRDTHCWAISPGLFIFYFIYLFLLVRESLPKLLRLASNLQSFCLSLSSHWNCRSMPQCLALCRIFYAFFTKNPSIQYLFSEWNTYTHLHTYTHNLHKIINILGLEYGYFMSDFILF